MSTPPDPRRSSVTRWAHGGAREDAYAWLAGSGPEVLEHLRAERAFHDARFAHLVHLADSLVADISSRSLLADASVSLEHVQNDYHVRWVQGKAYREIVRIPRTSASDSADAEPVLDPNAWADDTAYFRLHYWEPSPDERRLAFAVDTTGDERCVLRFLDLETGEVGPEAITDVGPGIAWSPDGRHVVYVTLDAQNRPDRAWLHELGTDPASDRLLVSEPDARFNLSVSAAQTGEWAIVGCASRVTADARAVRLAGDFEVVDLLPRTDGLERRYELGQVGGVRRLFCITNEGDDEFRLLSAPDDPRGWSRRAAYQEESLPCRGVGIRRLVGVRVVGEHLVLTCRIDGEAGLLVVPAARGRCDPTGAREVRPLFAGGTLSLVPSRRAEATEVLVADQSRIEPRQVSRLDLTTGERVLVARSQFRGHDPDCYRSERLEVEADDGCLVPATIVRRADTPLDGTAPALMYAYGAYETVFEPLFSTTLLSLLDRGVVFVHAHVRGGGELGHHWWLQGRLGAKERTFGDHIAVAEALGTGIVDRRRIATRGMSAGGLVQAAVFTRRPDLWCGVIAEVPWVDVVNSMSDPSTPLVVRERDEWGDPLRPDEYAWMLAYSPYENQPPPGVRPPLLVTGAVHDTRVLVREPAKWVAALRHSDPAWASQCLFRVETGAGSHGGPSGNGLVRYEAELQAWLLDRFGLA